MVLSIVVLALVLLVAVVVIVRLGAYKVTHPHTAEDLVVARRQSVAGSRATVTGQVKEHLLPLLPEWPYNPRDAKFLGQPVDFVVFDGLCDDRVERVVFVEVKTGRSGRLSPRERSVRDAVRAGRVDYEVIRLGGYEDTDRESGVVGSGG